MDVPPLYIVYIIYIYICIYVFFLLAQLRLKCLWLVFASLFDAEVSQHPEAVLLRFPSMDKLLTMVIDSQQPMRPILDKMSKDSGQAGYKRAYNELHSSGEIDTLHGKLVKQLKVVGSDGASMFIDYISPIPFIVHACATSLGFFRLMQLCVHQAPGNVLRFVFYHDAVTPGNNMRPDIGRTFISFMWSFLELPQWMKNRSRLRWFVFTYVQKKQMKCANIEITNIVKAIMLDMFRDSECNFETTGVLLRHGAETLVARMKFKTCPQDWLAQVDMFGLKGPKGLNPCPLCDNCMGRRALFEDDSGFSHVLSPVYSKFKLRDAARMMQITTCIAEAVADGDPAQIDKIEKATGIVYDPDGLLFDKDLEGIFDWPTAVFADTAHCLTASGGVAQYHLNQLVLSIMEKTSFTLEDLDSFAKKVTLPRSWSKLSKTFFQDRIVHQKTAHMRAFASEVSLAVDVLGLFVEMIIGPSECAAVLSAEITCFNHLKELLDHISKGTYEHAHPALDACQKHHQCFLALYQVCATPKLHYTWHAILTWIALGVLVTCLGAEAEHKQPKRVMAHSYKNCTKTALSHWLRSFLGHLNDPTTFAPTHLPLEAKQCDYTVSMGNIVAQILRYSQQVATPVGTFHKGDLLHWNAHIPCVGIAKFFFMARFERDVQFVAVVQQFSPVQMAPDLWQEGEWACVCTSLIIGAVPFVKEGIYVRPHSFA